MKNSIRSRERALSLIEEQLPHLSKLYRECHRNKGRGAFVLHTLMLEKNQEIGEIAYNTKNESLDLFDNVSSRTKLRKLIANYDPTTAGILILIGKSGAA